MLIFVVGAQNIQPSHQRDLRKTRHVKQNYIIISIHPVSRYKANSGKNKIKTRLMHFDANASVFVLSN